MRRRCCRNASSSTGKGLSRRAASCRSASAWARSTAATSSILDDGSAVYLWSGREASVKEKQRGAEVAKGIKDERVHQVELLGEVVIHRLEQGQKSEDEHPEFWAVLGGDKSMVRPAVADSAEDDAKGARRRPSLYRLHESEDGKKALTIEKVKGVPLRAALDPTDTFVLVCPGEIYAWIGSKATDGERKHAMLKAQEFIMSRGMPVWTPVTRVVQGAEPTLFKAKFPDWASHSEGKIDVEKIPTSSRASRRASTSRGGCARTRRRRSPRR